MKLIFIILLMSSTTYAGDIISLTVGVNPSTASTTTSMPTTVSTSESTTTTNHNKTSSTTSNDINTTYAPSVIETEGIQAVGGVMYQHIFDGGSVLGLLYQTNNTYSLVVGESF